MTKESREPLDDDWSFDPFRLVLEDPTSDTDNWALRLPLLTKAKLLDQYVLPMDSHIQSRGTGNNGHDTGGKSFE